MKTKIVLSTNGEQMECEIDSSFLAMVWEWLRTNKAQAFIFFAKDSHGNTRLISLKDVDPDQTFNDVVYDRRSFVETFPEMAVVP